MLCYVVFAVVWGFFREGEMGGFVTIYSSPM